MITIVIMSTSLAEPNWVSLQGGGCVVNGVGLDHLGAFQFFYPGKFLEQFIQGPNNKKVDIVYKFGPNDLDRMENCVTNKAVILMKTIIAFTFIAMCCTLIAFLLDLIGPQHRALKILRRNAIFNIVSVILCVIINLFCYWLTEEVSGLQRRTKFHVGSKVEVTFDISFYLITAAGAMGVIATAMNCLKRFPTHDHMTEALLEDYDGLEGVFPVPPPEAQSSPLSNIPPPPAYTP